MASGQSGQSISEYGLIGGILVLITLPVLVLLGSNLNGSFQAMVPQPSQTAKVTATGNSGFGTGEITVPVNSSGVPLTGLYYSTQALAKEVQTAGANGATQVLASQLEQLAKQNLEAQKITQEQYGQIIALANQGHRLASLSAILENAAANAVSSDDFMNDSITVDGQEASMADLIYLLGFHQAYSDGLLQDPMQSAHLANPEMKVFIDLYQKVASSGTLADPAVAQEIQRLSIQIATINDALIFAAQDLGWDDTITPMDFTSATASRIANFNASTTTDQHSATICKYGNGQDSGAHCSG